MPQLLKHVYCSNIISLHVYHSRNKFKKIITRNISLAQSVCLIYVNKISDSIKQTLNLPNNIRKYKSIQKQKIWTHENCHFEYMNTLLEYNNSDTCVKEKQHQYKILLFIIMPEQKAITKTCIIIISVSGIFFYVPWQQQANKRKGLNDDEAKNQIWCSPKLNTFCEAKIPRHSQNTHPQNLGNIFIKEHTWCHWTIPSYVKQGTTFSLLSFWWNTSHLISLNHTHVKQGTTFSVSILREHITPMNAPA